MCGKTKLLGRRVEILIFGTMPVRLSEIPQSDLSELRAMERRGDPWINMWHQRSSHTPTSALQPQYPILGTSTSAPNLIPHLSIPTSYPNLSTPTSYPSLSIPTSAPQPQHPNLIPQPQHPNLIPQPQHPNLSTPTSAPQPQYPNLIPQPQHPKCESMPLASFSHRYLQSCLRMPQKGQRSSRVLLQHATGTQNCV